LLAMAADQSILKVTDRPLSRAGSLPQGLLLNRVPVAGTRFTVLADGHQTGITTRRSRVNAQRPLDH
ncbi:hypothetical protein EJA72_19130, partial [Pseudomonas sp. PB120]|nr:hypothetical protein [Pseudomonas sp. PB120]